MHLLPTEIRLVLNWNRAMAAFHTLFAIATLAFAAQDGSLGMTLPLYRVKFSASAAQPDHQNASYPEVMANRDENGEFVAFVATRKLIRDSHDLYITWIAVGFSALSALFHILNVYVWRKWYLDGIADARCPSRWIEYSLSAPLQAIAIAYVTGTTTTDSIVAVFGLISTTMFFGHLCEVSARPTSALTWNVGVVERLTPHFLGYVPFLIAMTMILQAFSRASQVTYTDPTTNEAQGMPGYVYAIVASQLGLFTSFTVVQLVVTTRAPKDYIWGEVAYMVLSLVAKGVLSLLLVANVIAISIFS